MLLIPTVLWLVVQACRREGRPRGGCWIAPGAMVSWFLILCICVMIVVLMGVNFYLLVHYLHPDDVNEAWTPKGLLVREPSVEMYIPPVERAPVVVSSCDLGSYAAFVNTMMIDQRGVDIAVEH
jgi:hypothetical protein